MKKFLKKINWNRILFAFMIVLIGAFLGFIWYANILPLKYFLLVITVMILWLVLLFFLLVFKTKRGKNRKRKISGYVISAFLVVLMGIVFYYLYTTLGFIGGFGNNKYKEENFLILVLQDSQYQKLEDLQDKTIGYVPSTMTKIGEAINELNQKLTIENKTYEQYDKLFEDLMNKMIDSVLVEESYMNLLKENNEYDDLFRTLYTINIKTEIEMNNTTDVTNNTFTVFISGIDSYGKIGTVARSDVNMIATVNPKTKQVLLVSIPRDYYVQLRGTTGYKDKLTHAGIYGVETSVGTIEDLLDVDINYYLRVNFSTLEEVIDSIGGVDVYSKYTFTTVASTGSYRFYEGYNHMNGKQALAFARERKHLPGGDRTRGANQQAVIDGIVRKATSSAIITKYSKILNALSDTFQTNMDEKDIQKLIKMQLNDMAKWNITSFILDGTDANEYTYSYQHQKLYVMKPKEESVTEAQQLIDKVYSGEMLESSFDDNITDIKDPIQVKPSVPDVKPEEPVEKSSNNYLSSLSFSNGIITFDKETLNYNINMDSSKLAVIVSATSEDSKATVTGVGEKTLIVGENTIVIVVTAENGEQRTYTVKITVSESGGTDTPDPDPLDPIIPVDPNKPENPDDTNQEGNGGTASNPDKEEGATI